MSQPIAINDMFARLIAANPSYEALRTYVASLGIQVNAKDGDPLVVMRYNRETADMTNPIVRAFRSVIWDSFANRPLFVAPMKSEPQGEMPLVFTPNYITEDFVDGVMVNLFYDPYKQTWRMSTRSRLDADNKFFDHTFEALFNQAWSGYFSAPQCGEPTNYDMLNKNYGYSFVLQHPSNRIVVPVLAPSLTCVEISGVDKTTNLVSIMASPATMLPPRRFITTGLLDCQTIIANMQQFEGIKAQGLVVRDLSTGRRWKMRTDLYKQVRLLRGNHSKLEYTWFENFKNGTLETYLTFYPEERVKATAALAQWSKVVSDTYNLYVHVFKVRDCPKTQIPVQYKGILFDLHGQYLSRLAPAKQSLTWAEHQAIMGRQDLKRMVFLATYKNGA
jgi:hypothetical protein